MNGDVRLSGACLPRKAIFPSDPEDCPSSDFVYLPRDVLHGNQYNAASDIYCFAIMSLELDAESPLRVFEEERCWTVKQFRSFNATQIFESKLKASSFSKEMKLHLNMCLSANESIRPTASDLWAELNRLMEKKPKRISVINGTVAPRHLWASYRKK